MTLEDIEKNLKKYSDSETMENLQEFINKAKSSNGTNGFLSFTFKKCDFPGLPVTETPELIDPKEIAYLNLKGSQLFATRSPRNNFSNSSILRFGLSTLEAIEESLSEDILQEKDNGMNANYKSEKLSPQLRINWADNLTGRNKANTLREKRVSMGKRKSLVGKAKSPYSEVLRLIPQWLPSIKKSDQTLSFLKTMNLSKKRMSLN